MFNEETRTRLVALGERLKQRRQAKGMTLHDLSEASGFHTSYLGRIERAERRPSAPVLRQIAEPLGFTDVELFKMAGYLSDDRTDDRIGKLKDSLKGEIRQAMSNLLEKVDTL
ncbi:hypothetical protein LCGC14_1625730 [marine sediment metagenome]|uniref:HTH cro/C1-type domain-containing protein n=1 Tax=marine sediment metagenome TaxID=412755 RepID=A0A0F9I458_9ZZZZ